MSLRLRLRLQTFARRLAGEYSLTDARYFWRNFVRGRIDAECDDGVDATVDDGG